jgi:glycine betaine/choline ABC-type transport system substrate-binding protein/uncharacterized coiled-coil protein SlyX
MPGEQDVDARLTTLEVKLTFAEDHIERLDALIVRQQQSIDLLIREIARLREQAAATAETPGTAQPARRVAPALVMPGDKVGSAGVRRVLAILAAVVVFCPFLQPGSAVAATGEAATGEAATARATEPVLRIGSKRFTEAYLLAEILGQTAQPFAQVEIRAGLGNTAIVFEALRSGAIDLYPDYLGTIDREILKNETTSPPERIVAQLARLGLGVAIPLGFSNGYALAMREAEAARRGITNLGDLARHPSLRAGLSAEFIGRPDGWPGLRQRYGLPQQPISLDHGLAYEALAAGRVDVTDIYTTDSRSRRWACGCCAMNWVTSLAMTPSCCIAWGAAPVSAGLAGDAGAVRSHRRDRDDRDEFPRRTAGCALCGHRSGFPEGNGLGGVPRLARADIQPGHRPGAGAGRQGRLARTTVRP